MVAGNRSGQPISAARPRRRTISGVINGFRGMLLQKREEFRERTRDCEAERMREKEKGEREVKTEAEVGNRNRGSVYSAFFLII